MSLGVTHQAHSIVTVCDRSTMAEEVNQVVIMGVVI